MDTIEHNSLQLGVFGFLCVSAGESSHLNFCSIPPLGFREDYVCALWILYGSIRNYLNNDPHSYILRALLDGDAASSFKAPKFKECRFLCDLHMDVLSGTYHTTFNGVGELRERSSKYQDSSDGLNNLSPPSFVVWM
ncbi:unnamed protein product [Pieris brassicae]|uniref:Uncharacterized protein n=1 Tax=Pieris brassicae TaxID=7116 RepID=A0A9P0THD7_PIEBR|nr:unnamed protein product [Pieris brassicae]